MRNISIFFWRKLRLSSDQRYAATKSAHRLRQLQPDVAAAQNDQMFGKPLQIENLDMRHWPRVRKPRYLWDCGVGSDVHEYALTDEGPFATFAKSHLESTRSDKSSVPPDQFSSRCAVLVEMNFHQVVDHLFLARVDAGHVDRKRSSFYPKFLVSPK